MGHLKYDKKTRAESTPVEWLGIGAAVGELANQWADRHDLVGYVGPGAGGVAPACYTPATAEVEVNVEVAFGGNISPETIGDLRVRSNQFEWPKATGAIFHEALHARFSNWDIEAAFNALSPAEFKALIYLEEGRIEYNGVTIMPENRAFLRASALEIVVADLKEEAIQESDTRVAAAIAALTMARVSAGVLQDEDIEAITPLIESKLGAATLAKLREIWIAVQEHKNHLDATAMYPLARKWVEIVNEQAEENGEPDPGEGTPDENGAEGSGGIMGEMLEALEEAAGTAAINASGDLDDQQTTEEWSEIAKERGSSAKTQKEHESIANEVFGQGTGPMADGMSSSRLVEERTPSAEERAAAVTVARLLEKAKYRERDVVEIASIVPPGRLRTRAMVQGAALKSKGIMTQVEPWRRSVRKHTDEPTLNIGVMVDISGSMSEAMNPMAVTAWVMSEAARRIQARAAMVYYGQGVFPTLKPGQHLDKVNVYTASDGTEKFDKAFKALNGSLNLLNGSGARMLVVVSDGCYTHQESQAARRWVNECDKAGVGVLWLPFDDRGGAYASSICKGSSAIVLKGVRDPAAVATEIGAAAAKAMTTVSSKAA
jgi:hypothetical protein